jgi:hypothetical protein
MIKYEDHITNSPLFQTESEKIIIYSVTDSRIIQVHEITNLWEQNKGIYLQTKLRYVLLDIIKK